MSIEDKALIGRRTFLKGVGLAATTTAVAGPGMLFPDPLLAAETLPRQVVAGGLGNAPVVMLWRRVTDLGRNQEFVERTTRLPALERNATAVVYDGGSVLVGYGAGELAPGKGEDMRPRPHILSERYRLQLNPASTVVHMPLDFAASHDRLKKGTRGNLVVRQAAQRESLHFVDQDGNESCFCRPSPQTLSQPEGRKLREVMDDCSAASKSRPGYTTPGMPRVDVPVGALELMVSDLARSTTFYSEALGLKVLASADDETHLNLGTIVLTLRPERSGMLLEFLNRTGRLLGDWPVFHVNNLEQMVENLCAQGVKFPSGIEAVPVGRVAYMNDPDGHPWVLWQPSGRVESLGYYPALSRILTNGGRGRPS
jgi:predicted enzyme related to lactoylglutathione lyase